jgi:hypothetical protein
MKPFAAAVGVRRTTAKGRLGEEGERRSALRVFANPWSMWERSFPSPPAPNASPTHPVSTLRDDGCLMKVSPPSHLPPPHSINDSKMYTGL